MLARRVARPCRNCATRKVSGLPDCRAAARPADQAGTARTPVSELQAVPLRARTVPRVPSIHAPPRDPVAEIFDAITQARRSAPGCGTACRVAIRSRTGQLLASFVLDNPQQLQSFGERMVPLGYRESVVGTGGNERHDFSVDRRAANEALHAPHRRRDDAGTPLAH